MKAPSTAMFVFMTLIFIFSLVGADIGCTGTSIKSSNNWYCSAVTRMSYQGVGPVGNSAYPLVVHMNGVTGECEKTSQAFSGKLAPLNDDLSVHFRGPLVLKQFAVYLPSAQSSKRHVNVHHGHQHTHSKLHNGDKNHRHVFEEAKRDVGDPVTATIDGKVVSWINQYDESAPCAVPVTATIDGAVVSWINNYCGPSTDDSSPPTPPSVPLHAGCGEPPASSPETPSMPSPQQTSVSPTTSISSTPSAALGLLPGEIVGSGSWVRTAYYSADDQNASGIMFLNNMGATNQSGAWDPFFGNTLSFANANSSLGSGESQIFAGTLEKNNEIAIFSDTNCTEEICGYWRPGSVAYYGFPGSEKAFFMEFSMPDDGNTEQGYNMPAIWFLNGKIPRTQQYGKCSCWPSCGEFDAFEVLTPGYAQMKATLLGIINGGISDYFERPVNGTMKGAVIFNNNNIVVQALDDDFDFGTSLSLDEISALTDATDGTNWVLTP